MRDYNRELAQLRERIAQRRENITVLGQLRQQEKFWRREVELRQAQWAKEQRDVDQLEKVSVSSIWASLRGTKDEDIDREKAEAWTARLKFQEAKRQLEEVFGEIEDRELRIRADEGCEVEYESLLLEKEREYRDKDPILAAKLKDIEQRELQLTSQLRELQEAVDAGERALKQIYEALAKLSDAESWSTWDMLGGGLLTDMMKYSNLDDAQCLMEGVQSELRRYQAELADVAQEITFNLQPEGMLRAADYFFDNIFTDWAVRDKIMQSDTQLREVSGRVCSVQKGIRQQLENARQELTSLQAEREEAVRLA